MPDPNWIPSLHCLKLGAHRAKSYKAYLAKLTVPLMPLQLNCCQATQVGCPRHLNQNRMVYPSDLFPAKKWCLHLWASNYKLISFPQFCMDMEQVSTSIATWWLLRYPNLFVDIWPLMHGVFRLVVIHHSIGPSAFGKLLGSPKLLGGYKPSQNIS